MWGRSVRLSRRKRSGDPVSTVSRPSSPPFPFSQVIDQMLRQYGFLDGQRVPLNLKLISKYANTAQKASARTITPRLQSAYTSLRIHIELFSNILTNRQESNRKQYFLSHHNSTLPYIYIYSPPFTSVLKVESQGTLQPSLNNITQRQQRWTTLPFWQPISESFET